MNDIQKADVSLNQRACTGSLLAKCPIVQFYVPTLKIKAEIESEEMILLFELPPTIAAEFVLVFLFFFFWKFYIEELSVKIIICNKFFKFLFPRVS